MEAGAYRLPESGLFALRLLAVPRGLLALRPVTVPRGLFALRPLAAPRGLSAPGLSPGPSLPLRPFGSAGSGAGVLDAGWQRLRVTRPTLVTIRSRTFKRGLFSAM